MKPKSLLIVFLYSCGSNKELATIGSNQSVNTDTSVVDSDNSDGNDTDNTISVKRRTIAAGVTNTVGVLTDGTIIATKYTGEFGSEQPELNEWTDIISVATGDSFTVGLKSDGSVVATGRNVTGQCDVSNWKDIVFIAAGNTNTVDIKSDGTVIATKYTGKYYNGQCDVDTWKNINEVGILIAPVIFVEKWKDIISISAGDLFTVGLKNDGTVVLTGSIDDYDVENWKGIISISAGDSHIIGLKTDGTVVATGSSYHGQCEVKTWSDIVEISAGTSNSVGLKSDGTVVSTEYIGDYYCGECEVSDWKNVALP